MFDSAGDIGSGALQKRLSGGVITSRFWTMGTVDINLWKMGEPVSGD